MTKRRAIHVQQVKQEHQPITDKTNKKIQVYASSGPTPRFPLAIVRARSNLLNVVIQEDDLVPKSDNLSLRDDHNDDGHCVPKCMLFVAHCLD